MILQCLPLCTKRNGMAAWDQGLPWEPVQETSPWLLEALCGYPQEVFWGELRHTQQVRKLVDPGLQYNAPQELHRQGAVVWWSFCSETPLQPGVEDSISLTFLYILHAKAIYLDLAWSVHFWLNFTLHDWTPTFNDIKWHSNACYKPSPR